MTCRHAEKSKLTCNGRGIAFDGKGMCSFGNGFVRNVVIFRVENISPSYTEYHNTCM